MTAPAISLDTDHLDRGVLADYLARTRWFAGKGRPSTITAVRRICAACTFAAMSSRVPRTINSSGRLARATNASASAHRVNEMAARASRKHSSACSAPRTRSSAPVPVASASSSRPVRVARSTLALASPSSRSPVAATCSSRATGVRPSGWPRR